MNEAIKKYLQKSEPREILQLTKEYTVNFLAQGEYNINYLISSADGRKFVFRMNTESQLQLDNQINYEFDALKLLERSGCTPKPIFVDGTKQNFPYGILVMEYLEGRPLQYDTDLDRAAKIFATIHSMPTSESLIWEKNLLQARITECERLLENVFSNNQIDKEVLACLEGALLWCKKHVDQEQYFQKADWWVINNTEVNSHNFIIGPEKEWLIDWEKPVVSHPCQDITQFLAVTTTMWRENVELTSAEKTSFLKNYATLVGCSFEEIETAVNIYNPYLYLRALSWCAMAFGSYSDGTKAVQNEEIFAKIKSYLDAGFIQRIFRECGCTW